MLQGNRGERELIPRLGVAVPDILLPDLEVGHSFSLPQSSPFILVHRDRAISAIGECNCLGGHEPVA